MISDDPTRTGVSPDLPTGNRQRFEPLGFAVHLLLLIYLSPVILLVAVIGVTSILFNRSVQLASKLADGLGRILARPAGAPAEAARRSIGVRPVATRRGVRPRSIR